MKVVAFNGSPNKEGNTYLLLKMVCKELEKEGVETEIIHVGDRNIHGCIGCAQCRKNLDNQCVFNDDIINPSVNKIIASDGILLGSPVYFASLSSQMKAFIDRVGYVCRANSLLKRKVGASVVAVRRNGAIPAFNAMNHFFTISECFLVGSTYWNQGIGKVIGDVESDTEGVETMKHLGQNMAWLLKKIHD